MPIYEYQCKSCGFAFEQTQKMSDAPLTRCPKCKGVVQKLLSKSSFHLKGSGWYVTDYKKDKTSQDKDSLNKTSQEKTTEIKKPDDVGKGEVKKEPAKELAPQKEKSKKDKE